ncbi:TPA: hypothetical protein ACK8Z3_001364 [Legionella pneumophila]|uniref:Uncharacterized protein n=3 Tax=Legionella pneumophila TaxID=446 RepID=Q5ZX78_LEGPH|nr:hypothetical protein [Legionella pneumophila]ERH42997.1 hypothetical protein N750_13445 [Legionella pneumophila str. Leg01/53]ERH45295.1 hypothetical protein N751_11155 [Legionella pneumophila str. Leg01/11]ERI48506.1 hypothetical protein N749_01200 [Legionella pneumophila str. Leg01/20]WBV62445.1 hypothetical protein PGH43_11080 [Legionella pneumophila 130b]AAU26942.1 hypothetical protein lpg0854 [Legionella pneumophila subsp. pneumophila str. Philadelphia 1]
MSDFKSKLPDLNELTSMTAKLFKGIKTSVSEIIQDYKQKRAQPVSTEEKTTENKPAESKAEPKTESKTTENKTEPKTESKPESNTEETQEKEK